MAETISDWYRSALLSIRQNQTKKWGTTGARNGGAAIVEILKRYNLPTPTLVDYGAGEGTLLNYIANEYPSAKVFEYDPCVPGKEEKPQGTFDFVVSTDVLEHVELEMIDAVLRECFDMAGIGVFHHIATCLTGRYLPDGRDMHILCKPYEWWKDKLTAIGEEHGFLLMESSDNLRRQRGELKTSCRFYFERG